MDERFSVGGRSAATLATIDHVAAQLWNPHASISIQVLEIGLFSVTAGLSNIQLIRTSTIGTSGSTVTPDLDNHYRRIFQHIALPTLGLAAYSVQPTLQGPPLRRINLPAAVGAGFIWDYRDCPLVVPAGTGLAFSTPVAVILPSSDVYFVWE